MKKILIAVIVCLLAAALLIGLYFIPVRTAAVEGNVYLSDSEVLNRFFSSEEDRNLLSTVYTALFKKNLLNGAGSIRVRLKGLTSVSIIVSEADAAVQIDTDSGYAVLSDSGIVMCILPEKSEGLLTISGIGTGQLKIFEKPSMSDEDADRLDEVLYYAECFRNAGIEPDELYVSEGSVRAVFGNVTIILGDASYAEEKCREISDQLSAYGNLTGLLHMENYDPNAEKQRFYMEITGYDGTETEEATETDGEPEPETAAPEIQPEETQPETAVPETQPETAVPETQPEELEPETAAPEIQPEETQPETSVQDEALTENGEMQEVPAESAQ